MPRATTRILDMQYLRARYCSPSTANFLTEDSYLGDISDPLTLNRYNYVKGSPLNYIDPSGHIPDDLALANRKNLQKNVSLANSSDAKRANERITGQTSSESAKRELNEKQRKAWNYIKDLIQKAQDKTNDFVISCESYSAGVNAVNNSLGSGGVLVTAEGVEIPGAVVVSGAEEGIASVSGGIITGLLAAFGAAGDQEGGSGKGDSDSHQKYEVSDSRREHILEGDPPGTGHGPNRGNTGGAFPDTWTDDQAIDAIERVANSPNSTWKQATGSGYRNAPVTQGGPDPNAPLTTNSGSPVRFRVQGQDHGLNIEVIVEPGGEGIITGYVK